MARDYTLIKCQVCGVCWEDHAKESPDCRRVKPEGFPDQSTIDAAWANRDLPGPKPSGSDGIELLNVSDSPVLVEYEWKNNGDVRLDKIIFGVEKVRSLNDPEPPSIDSGNPACWDYAIEDFEYRHKKESYCEPLVAIFRERNEIGVKKYGKPVMVYNNRNALVDVFQELLDSYAYMTQKLLETGVHDIKYMILDNIYKRIEVSIIQIHAMLTTKG